MRESTTILLVSSTAHGISCSWSHGAYPSSPTDIHHNVCLWHLPAILNTYTNGDTGTYSLETRPVVPFLTFLTFLPFRPCITIQPFNSVLSQTLPNLQSVDIPIPFLIIISSDSKLMQLSLQCLVSRPMYE